MKVFYLIPQSDAGNGIENRLSSNSELSMTTLLNSDLPQKNVRYMYI